MSILNFLGIKKASKDQDEFQRDTGKTRTTNECCSRI